MSDEASTEARGPAETMSTETALDFLAHVRGTLTALEATVTNLAWQWALSQPHPPIALARLFQPLEQQLGAIAASPETDTRAAAAMMATVQGMGEALQAALHEETLRRTGAKNPGPN